MKKRSIAGLMLSGALLASSAGAVELMPNSYAMPNGQSGSYHYWDESYSGTGNTSVDGAALSGGLGDLTDGAIALANWNIVEAPSGPGPYVGWSSITPTITFDFGVPTNIQKIDFYFDDSNGVGGVTAPGSVDIAGTNYGISDPAGSAPFMFSVSGLNLNASTLDIRINDGQGPWVFVSEIDFFGPGDHAVPEPGVVALMGLGLAGLGFARRKKSS